MAQVYARVRARISVDGRTGPLKFALFAGDSLASLRTGRVTSVESREAA